MKCALILVRDSAMLGRALRDARRAHGWTQHALALRAGIRQPTVSDAERGAANVSLETLWRLLAALELDLAIVPRVSRDAAAAWDSDGG